MEPTIKDVTELNLNDIPETCNYCIYWSFPEEFERTKSELSKRKQELMAKGLGEELLDSIIADLKRRGFKAIETYARKGSPEKTSGPVELYLKKGFNIKNEANPEFPIVRLNLQS